MDCDVRFMYDCWCCFFFRFCVVVLLKYANLTIQNESMRISELNLHNSVKYENMNNNRKIPGQLWCVPWKWFVTLRWLWQLMISAVCDWREATRSLHAAIWLLDKTMHTLSSENWFDDDDGNDDEWWISLSLCLYNFELWLGDCLKWCLYVLHSRKCW